ncbi:uncharacterized protein JCM15063_005079 [Sporobolomyces koalae]|uniref:uncharacterized protein n=1 Tax=Sporobolomyces koalae TaxID=500713 RepID=UPI003176648E
MTDYSAFAPARPPQSPTGPAPSSSSHFALAPQFNNLQIDQAYPRYPEQQSNYSQYPQQQQQQQQREYSQFQQGGPPRLTNLHIPASQAASASSARSPTSPGAYGYSDVNRPWPSNGGGANAANGPAASTGDSPTRIPRKSSLAAKSGMASSSSHERLPPIPTSSSSMHFPKAFGDDAIDSQRDSTGGEAVFNGADLTSDSRPKDSLSSPSQAAPVSAPPPNPAAPAPSASKKANPLEDLIATETLYVEDLGGVIKRVAAAWSRSNFPPPALDTMFRAVEAVYRINKILLGKLNEIGPNPSSPKALGDLLMRWISDIEPAYSRYGSTLLLDFDSYPPVQSNPKLAPILASLPWPGTLPSPDQYGVSPNQVSLDRLFELPVHRIRYYKKLLRSSSATGTSTANTSAAAHNLGQREPPLKVDELEMRLSTERTLDIFTMQPRKCKLQMQPATLSFQRQLRKASSAIVTFVPASDPSRTTVIHPRAYVVLLTDLFLLCEWTLPEESPSQQQDLTLLYPPLAGKHLRVSEPTPRGELEVSIMGKERLTIKFGGGELEARDWQVAMEEAARFGANPDDNAASDTLSLRADSGSTAHNPKSPLSPISTNLNPIPRVLSPPHEYMSPVQMQSPQYPSSSNRSLSRSPEPVSPNSSYSRQDSFNHFASLPPQQPSQQNDQMPPHLSVARPERNASFARNESPNAFLPSPSSSSFIGDNASNGSRGASPLRPDFNPQSSQQSLPNGRQSPFQIHPQPGDFGGPGNVALGGGGNYSSRPSSRTSQNSYASSSNRTDRSSAYPEPPPPLPKERSYNGLNISGRGGPLYPTSMRTDPGDSRSVSGHSDYLSPHNSVHRSKSAEALRVEPPQHYRMPSQALSQERSPSSPAFAPTVGQSIEGEDDSPPASPVDARGPQKTSVIADMRCKIFLQQHHSVWKSLGTAKLKLYQSMPSNTKQLVVDSDKSKGKTLISTIVLTDGVERVGKTGVAIELSDQGDRTGIIYMLQMKTEQSATGLFEQLLAGSDRERR